MRDFPPVGYATSLLHTKQGTIVLALPKIICSFLHLEQRTLMNLLRNVLSFILDKLHPLRTDSFWLTTHLLTH